MDLTSRSSKAKTSSEDSHTYLKYQLSDDSFVTVSMPYESIKVESEEVSLRVVTDPAPPVVAHRITSQEDEIGAVLLLVVATSRSMVDIQEDLAEKSGGGFATRGEVVLDAIDSLIDECRDEDVLGLVTFASRSEVVFPLENANKDNKNEWKRKLRRDIAFDGRENLEKGIIDALSQLEDLDKERYASASIMIICDGFINAGKGFINSMRKEKIKAAQKELVDFTKESLQEIEGLKVRVSVCGIGDGFDRGMLREMSKTGAARGLPYSLAQSSTLLESMKTALLNFLELERIQPAGRKKKNNLVANEMKIRIELNQGASLSIVKLRRLLRKGNKKSEGMKKISLDPFVDGDQSITFSPLPEKAMIDIPVLLGPADGLGEHDDEGQNFFMPRLPNTKNMYRIATIYVLWLKDDEVIEEEVKGYIDVVRKGNESILDEQIQRLNEIQDTMGGLIATLREVSGMDEMEADREQNIAETESELNSTQVDTVQMLEELLAQHKSFTKKLDNGNFTQREVDEVLQSKEMLSNLIDMFVAGRKAIDYVLKLKKDLEKADADEYVLGCDFASFVDLLCSSLETGLGDTGLDTDGTGGSDQEDTNELLMKAKEALDAVMAGLENAIEDGLVQSLVADLERKGAGIEDQEDEQKRGYPAPKRLSSRIRDSLKRLSRSSKRGDSQR